jgi:hypothetical protein
MRFFPFCANVQKLSAAAERSSIPEHNVAKTVTVLLSELKKSVSQKNSAERVAVAKTIIDDAKNKTWV